MMFEFRSNGSNSVTVDAADEESARTAAMRKLYGRVCIGGVSYEPPRGRGLYLQSLVDKESLR